MAIKMTFQEGQKILSLGLDDFDVNETMAQLRSGGVNIMMSWGFENPTNMNNKGLLFKVSGFIHKGYVLITLAFDDTYTVHLLDNKFNVIKTLEGVYCDELTDVIDSVVEKNESDDNYSKKVDDSLKELFS